MRPFHPPHPNPNQSHRGWPVGDPGPPHLPGAPMHPAFPPSVPNLPAAANPMVAAAAANPFLALHLLGQAQQLQNLGFLAAAALQQQQQAPVFQGGFPANPNQFAPYAGGPPPAGFNGGGAFRPGVAGICGPRPPRPMMSPNGSNNYNHAGSGGASRSVLNVGRKDHNNKAGSGGILRPILDVGKDRNSSAVSNGEANHFENKADGMSNCTSESENKITDQKSRFNAGRDGRGGRQFGGFRGRGRGRISNQGRGRGSNNWGEIKSDLKGHKSSASGHCSDIPAPASGGPPKRPPIVYDANDVKQWVEARKKNYPTSINVNKKLSDTKSDNQNKDNDAQLRRQELKEVLAKQQELGFDLPELPPGYLSETEDQGVGNKSNRNTQCRDSHFGNRGNTNKRPRYERGGFQSKRSKVWNRTPRTDGTMAKSREPTLLQKLLSSDIKRDRHRLLHTFRFMALNNFFEDWPDKPLRYPSVKVNQIEIESNIGTDDLVDVENAETAKDSSLDLKELSSNDGETGSANYNYNDEGGDGASADSSIEDGAEEEEDAYEEQFNEAEDDATSLFAGLETALSSATVPNQPNPPAVFSSHKNQRYSNQQTATSEQGAHSEILTEGGPN